MNTVESAEIDDVSDDGLGAENYATEDEDGEQINLSKGDETEVPLPSLFNSNHAKSEDEREAYLGEQHSRNQNEGNDGTSTIQSAIDDDQSMMLDGDKRKRKRKSQTAWKSKMCVIEGCDTQARDRKSGLCIKHGGGKKCKHLACTTSVYANGYCFKHRNEIFLESTAAQPVPTVLKSAECTNCHKHFLLPVCHVSFCKKLTNSNVFCTVHAMQLLKALQKQLDSEQPDVIMPDAPDQTTKDDDDVQNNNSEVKEEFTPLDLSGFTAPPIANTNKALHCHLDMLPISGKVDNPKDHERLILMSRPRSGRKRKTCSTPGCFSTARRGGTCIRHGGGKRCSYEGCDTAAYTRGLCVRHGGGRRCEHEGCERSARGKSSFCVAHGGERSGGRRERLTV